MSNTYTQTDTAATGGTRTSCSSGYSIPGGISFYECAIGGTAGTGTNNYAGGSDDIIMLGFETPDDEPGTIHVESGDWVVNFEFEGVVGTIVLEDVWICKIDNATGNSNGVLAHASGIMNTIAAKTVETYTFSSLAAQTLDDERLLFILGFSTTGGNFTVKRNRTIVIPDFYYEAEVESDLEFEQEVIVVQEEGPGIVLYLREEEAICPDIARLEEMATMNVTKRCTREDNAGEAHSFRITYPNDAGDYIGLVMESSPYPNEGLEAERWPSSGFEFTLEVDFVSGVVELDRVVIYRVANPLDRIAGCVQKAVVGDEGGLGVEIITPGTYTVTIPFLGTSMEKRSDVLQLYAIFVGPGGGGSNTLDVAYAGTLLKTGITKRMRVSHTVAKFEDDDDGEVVYTPPIESAFVRDLLVRSYTLTEADWAIEYTVELQEGDSPDPNDASWVDITGSAKSYGSAGSIGFHDLSHIVPSKDWIRCKATFDVIDPSNGTSMGFDLWVDAVVYSESSMWNGGDIPHLLTDDRLDLTSQSLREVLYD